MNAVKQWERVHAAIQGLSDSERALLRAAANSDERVGAKLPQGSFRLKAVELELVYRGSGLLRPLVLDYFRRREE